MRPAWLRASGIGRVIVPPSPGVFSAFGLLFAEVEHHFVQTLNQPLAAIDVERVNAILDRIGGECRTLLNREGFDKSHQRLQTQIDAKYEGQTSELTVDLPVERFSTAALPAIEEAFMREHRRTYGYSVEEPVQVVSLRVIGRGVAHPDRSPADPGPGDAPPTTGPARPPADRRVYFGPGHGWLSTPVVGRPALRSGGIAGPLIVEEYDSTTVVPPGWRAAAADHGCMTLEAVR